MAHLMLTMHVTTTGIVACTNGTSCVAAVQRLEGSFDVNS